MKQLFPDTQPEQYKGPVLPIGIERATRKACERTLQSKRAADGVQTGMFDDVKRADENGQADLF